MQSDDTRDPLVSRSQAGCRALRLLWLMAGGPPAAAQLASGGWAGHPGGQWLLQLAKRGQDAPVGSPMGPLGPWLWDGGSCRGVCCPTAKLLCSLESPKSSTVRMTPTAGLGLRCPREGRRAYKRCFFVLLPPTPADTELILSFDEKDARLATVLLMNPRNSRGQEQSRGGDATA